MAHKFPEFPILQSSMTYLDDDIETVFNIPTPWESQVHSSKKFEKLLFNLNFIPADSKNYAEFIDKNKLDISFVSH